MATKKTGLPRSYARQAAVQALYQLSVNDDNDAADLLKFVTAENASKIDEKYLKELVAGVQANTAALDEALSEAVDRSLASVDPVELAVLRVATYEFLYRLNVPYRVVINEAVESAKDMGGEMGHKYVNAVLDKVAAKTREVEVSAQREKRNK